MTKGDRYRKYMMEKSKRRHTSQEAVFMGGVCVQSISDGAETLFPHSGGTSWRMIHRFHGRTLCAEHQRREQISFCIAVFHEA